MPLASQSALHTALISFFSIPTTQNIHLIQTITKQRCVEINTDIIFAHSAFLFENPPGKECEVYVVIHK
jgi:hypothetical protein